MIKIDQDGEDTMADTRIQFQGMQDPKDGPAEGI